jgi:very-short-patch-repair endonuclease
VDFYFENIKTILEINGRHHFCGPTTLNAKTLWKHNTLKKLGYKVVTISIKNWNASEIQQKYNTL